MSITGRVLLQLTADGKLKAEYQDGACSTGMAFANPQMYQR
jgi:hypothetical protein